MKISVDGIELFELTETKKKVICNDIPNEIFDADMKRRLQWVLEHKYTRSFDRLKKEWEPKLVANGIRSIPTDKDELAELIFSQPNYEDRSKRDEKNKSSASK